MRLLAFLLVLLALLAGLRNSLRVRAPDENNAIIVRDHDVAGTDLNACANDRNVD